MSAGCEQERSGREGGTPQSALLRETSAVRAHVHTIPHLTLVAGQTLMIFAFSSGLKDTEWWEATTD